MQIYSSPALGLDLTHSAGSMGGWGWGGVVARHCGSDRAAAYWKLILPPFLGKRCHLHVTLIPGLLSRRATVGLTSAACAVSAPQQPGNDLLQLFACVNECHIQAIKASFSQLYQVSIRVSELVLQDSICCYSAECRASLLFRCCSRDVYGDGRRAWGDNTSVASVLYVLEPTKELYSPCECRTREQIFQDQIWKTYCVKVCKLRLEENRPSGWTFVIRILVCASALSSYRSSGA